MATPEPQSPVPVVPISAPVPAPNGPATTQNNSVPRTAGYAAQKAALQPKQAPPDPKMMAQVAKAARAGGDDNYVRETMSGAHLALATAQQKAGMIVNLLDGYTGDDDEAAILRILKSGGADATLASLKAMGHLGWLFSDVDGAEFDQLLAIPAQEIRAYRVRRLLSRNVLDWVVKASECRQVIEILKSVSGALRQDLVQRIIDSGQMETFLRNVDPADKVAHKAIFAGIPAHIRVNVLLSYKVILDWVVTDAEATEALEILLSVPAVNLDAVLRQAKVHKMLAEIPDAQRVRLKPLVDNAKDPMIKAALLKAYRHGATDAAYAAQGSDKTGLAADGTHAQIDDQVDDITRDYQKAAAKAGDPAAKKKAADDAAARLDATAAAMAKKLALETKHGIYLSCAPQATIYTLANLERFERVLAILPLFGQAKVVPAADAEKARDELLGMGKSVRGFMPWINIGPMVTALGAVDRESIRPLYAEATHPAQRAELFVLVHKADAHKKMFDHGADVTEDMNIMFSTGDEIDAEIAAFSATYTTERAKVQNDRKALAALDADFAKQLDALIERKQLELDVEFKYNVNITDSGPTKTWTMEELRRIKQMFDKLPADHAKKNKSVKEIRREEVAKDPDGTEHPRTGADHSGPLIRVYDHGTKGSYRNTGAESELGEHKAGAKAPHDPLSVIEEVLIHEVGHGVHDENAAHFAAFQAACGWESKDKAALKTMLEAAGKTGTQADAFIQELDDDREKHYNERPEKVYKGKVYVVDPYSSDYLARNLGSIPSTQDTAADVATDKRFGYARSNPKDHFAELYMLMAEVPEQTYQTLVVDPTATYEAKRRTYNEKKAAHDGLKAAAKPDASAIGRARRAMDTAKSQMDSAKASMDALVSQWTIMRNDIFDADSKEAGAIAAVTAAANALKDASKKAIALGKVATMESKVKICGTPHQIERLKERTLSEIAAL